MSDATRTSSAAASTTNEDPTIPYRSDAERLSMEADGALHDATEKALCANCQHPLRFGELTCPHCGIALSAVGKTNKISVEDLAAAKSLPIGQAFIEEQKSVMF